VAVEEMQKLSFSSGSRQLMGSLYLQSSAVANKRAVLFVHGQKSSQRAYKQRAEYVSSDLDAICLTFDLSGHGEDSANFSSFSAREHLEHVVAAYDQLASQPYADRARVGVCGASYGAYLAALLTAHRSVKRLVLRAPSLAGDIYFPTRQGRTLSLEVPEGLDSLKILGRYGGDVSTTFVRSYRSIGKRLKRFVAEYFSKYPCGWRAKSGMTYVKSCLPNFGPSKHIFAEGCEFRARASFHNLAQ
jgi:pimeloyl-ACP methyl ester carboxylesterase